MRKPKWIATGLPVKGNKNKAEVMLIDARKNFDPFAKNEEEVMEENVAKEDILEVVIAAPIAEGNEQTEDIDPTLFTDYKLGWLEAVKHSVEHITYVSYTNAVKNELFRISAKIPLRYKS